jgi:hypothetical protein
MADQFKPALPYPVKFSTSENEYQDSDKFPKAMSLFIPLESIQPLFDHCIKLGDTKAKTGKVWDYTKKEEVEVKGIYLNAKGKEGKYGDFGNINPQLIELSTDDMPF